MPKQDRCPICGVSVKAENLIRHLDATHPRHPDAPALKTKLKADSGRVVRPSREPLRINKWYLAAVGVVVLLVVGGVYGGSILFPSQGNSFSVDGCITDATVIYHIHPFLKIVINGNSLTIPDDTGITPTCVHPVHTHQSYGDPAHPEYAKIHVESPVAQPYKLGDFFHVWGQRFSSSQLLTYYADSTHPISMTVDGVASSAYGNLGLADGQLIVITYGP